MVDIPVRLLAAFTADGSGGNNGAVVYEDFPLTKRQRQTIASDLSVPTTGFVSRLDSKVFRTAFHSSTTEMPLCGHVTVAVFASLFRDGRIPEGEYIQQTAAGPVDVTVDRNGVVSMRLDCPTHNEVDTSHEQLAELLGVSTRSVRGLGSYQTGLHHLLVELDGAKALRELIEDNYGLRDFCSANSADTIGVWIPRSFSSGKAEVQLRDLCIGVGDFEESASGTTNAALAFHLFRTGRVKPDVSGRFSMVGYQGIEMGRPSRIYTTISCKGLDVDSVTVSGRAHLRMTGNYYLLI